MNFSSRFNSNNPLKVLHIISGDLWAGAEAMAHNLISHLSQFPDLEIQVIILNEGKLAEKLRSAGFSLYVINEQSNNFFQIFRKIKSIACRHRPDVIHSHRNKENLLAFFTYLALPDTRLVSTLHGLPEFINKRPQLNSKLKILLNNQILSRYFTTVAVSADIRNTLAGRFNFPANRIEVIHNGIDFSGEVVAKFRKDHFIVGSSGRLFPVKDFPLMIEIARLLSNSHGDSFRFLLAGDGPEFEKISTLINDYDLNDRFTLLGHQNNMSSFYNSIDLYINTSIHEGIPMTILEAFAHGIPVIAPAVGGIPEIVSEGEDGFLIETRDPHDFAKKCIYLQENESVRVAMARSAQENVMKSFSAQTMAASYHQLYYQIQHRDRSIIGNIRERCS